MRIENIGVSNKWMVMAGRGGVHGKFLSPPLEVPSKVILMGVCDIGLKSSR